MKLYTNRQLEAELERRDYERNRDFHMNRRIDELEKRVYMLDLRCDQLVAQLEGKTDGKTDGTP